MLLGYWGLKDMDVDVDVDVLRWPNACLDDETALLLHDTPEIANRINV